MTQVIVFDDLPDERDAVVASLTEALGDSVAVHSFKGEDSLPEGMSHEMHIEKWLDANRDDGTTLLVCDKELGRYENLRGLSATSVSVAALQLGLPFCQYSREAAVADRDFERFKRLSRWDSEDITLQGQSPDEWAKEAADLLRGFAAISEALDNLGTDRKRTPASSLAAILEKPTAESKLALYGSGDQLFLREVLGFYDPYDADADASVLLRRLPRLLGKWLRLSVLRFPGVLMNQIAAASYLNIAVVDFEKQNNRAFFKRAEYSGPFSALGPWWWREEIDLLLGDAGAEDGRAFLRQQASEAAECMDPQTGKRAGYYCMLTERPVSRENSKGGISWFPQGADLARIRKDKFATLTSLVGLF